MRSLQPALRRARAVALLAVGALAVHQAGYMLAGGFGTAAGQRHGYLELLVPVLAAATVAAIAVSLLAAALARRTLASLRPECTTERAALYALGLLAVYLCQELAEWLLAGGAHGSLVVGVLGGAGWFAPPLAVAVGALAAFAQRWLDRAELRLVAALCEPPRRAPRRIGAPRAARGRALSTLPLAFGLSRRPPPAALAG